MRLLVTLVLATLGLLSCPLSADVLWTDSFDSDSSARYDVLEFTEGRDGAQFAFDYGSVGIPSAPGTPNGSTTGLKLFANNPFEDTINRTSAVQIALADFADQLDNQDYSVTYDVWMNVNGPLPGGGGGSTEAMMVGVGFSANAPIEAGNSDGTYFTLTGEAGVLTDVRSFTNDGYNAVNEDLTPINPGGTSMEDPYFLEVFPGGVDVAGLPVQGGQDNQTGVTRGGQMAFQWHQVRVDVTGTEVSFYVDDLLIAKDLDATIDGTVFVGHADYFSSETDAPQWSFSVVDNLLVTTPSLGDFNRDGQLNAVDIDLLSLEVKDMTHNPDFDLNGDAMVDNNDRDLWVRDLAQTYFGDANFDGEFNSADLVAVFTAGEYEDGIPSNSGWATGDFDGDADFGSGDIVIAFTDGGYEQGPRGAAAVPEPTNLLAVGMALLAILVRRTNRCGLRC